MKILSACVIIMILAGAVNSQGGYSLIPPNVMLPTSSLAEAVGETLKNYSKKSTMESRKTTETMDSETSLLFFLLNLADSIKKKQRYIKGIENMQMSDTGIPKRSTVAHTNGSKTSPSYRHHRYIPAGHRRLVRQVRQITPDTAIDQKDPVTRKIPNRQVRSIDDEWQYSQVQPIKPDSNPVTYRPMLHSRVQPIKPDTNSVTYRQMFQAVAVTPEMV